LGYFSQVFCSPYISYLRATGYNQYNLLLALAKYGIQVLGILISINIEIKKDYILPLAYIISELIIFIFINLRYKKLDIQLIKNSFFSDLIKMFRRKEILSFCKKYYDNYLKTFKNSYYYLSLYISDYLRNSIPLNIIVFTSSDNLALLYTLGSQVSGILSRVEGSISGGLHYDFNKLYFNNKSLNPLIRLLIKSISLNSFFAVIFLVISKFIFKFENLAKILSDSSSISQSDLSYFAAPLLFVVLELTNMTYMNAFRALEVYKRIANFKLLVISVFSILSILLVNLDVESIKVVFLFACTSSIICLLENLRQTFKLRVHLKYILYIISLTILPVLLLF